MVTQKCSYFSLIISRGVFIVSKDHRKPETYREFVQSARILCIAKRTVILQLFRFRTMMVQKESAA